MLVDKKELRWLEVLAVKVAQAALRVAEKSRANRLKNQKKSTRGLSRYGPQTREAKTKKRATTHQGQDKIH